MIFERAFSYKPMEGEREKASNSYLMSLVAIIAGMPLPIVNFLATVLFYLANLKQSYFVRWHCIQAVFVQLLLFVINVIAISWLISIIFGGVELTNPYIAYVIMALIVNATKFVITIYSAIMVNRGRHVEWVIFGPLTNLLCKPNEEVQKEAV